MAQTELRGIKWLGSALRLGRHRTGLETPSRVLSYRKAFGLMFGVLILRTLKSRGKLLRRLICLLVTAQTLNASRLPASPPPALQP